MAVFHNEWRDMLRRIIKTIICLVAVFVAVILIFFLYCVVNTTHDITVTSYTINTNLANSLRIVQLTDLHEEEFGDNNRELIQIVEEQNPDLIVMTGDMQNKDDEDTSTVENLIRNLGKIADVYYSYGNHEKSWEKNFNRNFADVVKEAGGIIVDNDFVDIEINGNAIRIAGYMGYYSASHMLTHTEEEQHLEEEFKEAFENTDRYKILLNHIPTSWVDWGYLDDYSINLVFSGHYHGGQMVLPIVGPLYAPYIGFFPENVKGIYKGEQTTCVLSTGLGTEYYIPRVNNPPEIVVVDLVKEE